MLTSGNHRVFTCVQSKNNCLSRPDFFYLFVVQKQSDFPQWISRHCGSGDSSGHWCRPRSAKKRWFSNIFGSQKSDFRACPPFESIFRGPSGGWWLGNIRTQTKISSASALSNNHENHSGRTKKAGDLGTVGLFWPREMFFGFMVESLKPVTYREFDGMVVQSGCY